MISGQGAKLVRPEPYRPIQEAKVQPKFPLADGACLPELPLRPPHSIVLLVRGPFTPYNPYRALGGRVGASRPNAAQTSKLARCRGTRQRH